MQQIKCKRIINNLSELCFYCIIQTSEQIMCEMQNMKDVHVANDTANTCATFE